MILIDKFLNNTLYVYGLSRSGLATIESLNKSDIDFFCWDDNQETRNKISDLGFANKLKKIEDIDLANLDYFVLSPGINIEKAIPQNALSSLKNSKCKIICDIEIFARQCSDKFIIGVTGSNGKSTTVTLISHILSYASMDNTVGGNIGIPVLSLDEKPLYVIELSSYQLELIETARFNVAVLTNITPNHIDRHGDLDGYIKAKLRIFKNQTSTDIAVINIDSDVTLAISNDLKNVVPVSTKQVLKDGVGIIDSLLYYKGQKYHINPDKKSIPILMSKHNIDNLAASFAVAAHLGVKPEVILESIASYKLLPHRMEFIGKWGNISVFNDSKATTGVAAAKAIESLNNIYVIMGGIAKADSLDPVIPFFSNIAHAYLIGEAADKFSAIFNAHNVNNTISGTLEQAIDDIMDNIKDIDEEAVILLSPACASTDQFKDFEDRGRKFVEYISKVIK